MHRYARQTILPELGQQGQHRLQQASVLCIGAGGLGSPALLYLAAAGIGRLGLVDDDTVDVSNLHRQVLFKEADAGAFKVFAAAATLKARNSQCIIEPYSERFTTKNAEKLISNYDVIIDGTDNFGSKFLINDACVKFNKPLIYGSILGFEAQVCVFWAAHGACYRCLYPKAPSTHIPNCAQAGVIGAMAGIAGTVQALEAIKMALGLDWCKDKKLEPLLGKLWMLDARTLQTRVLAIHKRPHCTVCSHDAETLILEDGSQLCSAHQAVAHLSYEQAAQHLGMAVFIDVRESHEWMTGRIENARHIPLHRLLSNAQSVQDIPLDTPLIVYCQHGIRSLSAAAHLQTLGFHQVSHLAGGLVHWKAPLI